MKQILKKKLQNLGYIMIGILALFPPFSILYLMGQRRQTQYLNRLGQQWMDGLSQINGVPHVTFKGEKK